MSAAYFAGSVKTYIFFSYLLCIKFSLSSRLAEGFGFGMMTLLFPSQTELQIRLPTFSIKDRHSGGQSSSSGKSKIYIYLPVANFKQTI